VVTTLQHNGFFSEEAMFISAAIKNKHKQLFFYLSEVSEQTPSLLGLSPPNP
jgi:hypothetical protein